ncbi:MAG: hypothetical protein AB1813_04025 [Verrucomicrobiota bacterium]
MNILPAKFGSPARLVESTDLPHFLELAYEAHFGEVWLYNNDLQIIKTDQTFRSLYIEQIATTLSDKIDAVKILVNEHYEEAVFGPRMDLDLFDKFRQLAQMPNGRERLATFYFGRMSRAIVPDVLKQATTDRDTWIFYTHRGQLDSNPGVVMVRHTRFPFQNSGGRVAVVWQLRDQGLLQQQLKYAFQNCFETAENFMWMNVSAVGPPMEFQLSPGLSPETQRRRRARENQHSLQVLSVGDQADVAILTALDEEFAGVQRVFGAGAPTPLRMDQHRYIVVPTKPKAKIVLLGHTADMGGTPAAVWTWDIIEKWRPRYVILVGVAGGNPENEAIDLGDIALGNPVVAYEKARVTNTGLRPRLRTHEAGANLLSAAIQAKQTWSKRITTARPDKEAMSPKVHPPFGIGSGYKLVASKNEFRRLKILHDEIQAIEMEAEGVAYACKHHPHCKPEFLVVKGIMDKSDARTRESGAKDEWKKYAAEAAASFVRELIGYL